MKQRTKLIATLMAMCLVITLGVFGILAVKTLNMSVGGNITFTADGISFEVSKGEFKTTSGAAYTGITSQTGKLQAFAMNTNTKLADVQDKINSWSGLDLVATETLGTPELHFTITNLMEDEILSIDPTIDLGTNINDNMDIVMTPSFANIEYGTPQDFVIKFEIKDKSINGGLTGFSIDMLMSTAVIVDTQAASNMSIQPIEENSTEYALTDGTSLYGDVVIPAYVKQGNAIYPVTTIKEGAFTSNQSITSITIPSTVTRIENYSFVECFYLAGELVIPNSVTYLGEGAFYNCSRLTSLTLSENISEIKFDTFYGCTGLTGTLIIPDSVTSICMQAFFGCTGLKGLVVKNADISEYAFNGCSGLESVVLGNVAYIGEFGFGSCISLKNLVFKNMPSLGYSAFSGCSSLTGELVLTGITEIPNEAFSGCSFTSVVFDKSLTRIGNGAFDGNDFVEITIPSSVTYIGEAAFDNCTKLTSITLKSATPPEVYIYYGSFNNTNNCPIYVPNESYLTAEGWDRYASRMVVV